MTLLRHGDVFDLLKHGPQELAANMRVRDFEALVREKTCRFVGREFIFRQIDRVIADEDFPSGYIVIKGEPGIGKTALMAEFVKQHGCVHHFNIRAQNIRSTRCFLGNVCAQLIVKYGLDEKVLPKEYADDSGYLLHLLGMATEKAKGGPIIVAVDALDEADDLDLPAGANRLLLPPTLPKGVFFVVSMRAKNEERLVVDRREDISLIDDDPANVKDLKTYIQRYIEDFKSEMEPRIFAWGKSGSEFVDILADRAEGNFQYIHYVLPAIRHGELNRDRISRIEDLPSGLRAYYESHWRLMRDQDKERYRRLQRPVLCFLATAREPIDMSMLLEWIKQVPNNPPVDPSEVRDVIREWREYLNERRVEGGELLFHIYHLSFSEFLERGRVT